METTSIWWDTIHQTNSYPLLGTKCMPGPVTIANLELSVMDNQLIVHLLI